MYAVSSPSTVSFAGGDGALGSLGSSRPTPDTAPDADGAVASVVDAELDFAGCAVDDFEGKGNVLEISFRSVRPAPLLADLVSKGATWRKSLRLRVCAAPAGWWETGREEAGGRFGARGAVAVGRSTGCDVDDVCVVEGGGGWAKGPDWTG